MNSADFTRKATLLQRKNAMRVSKIWHPKPYVG